MPVTREILDEIMKDYTEPKDLLGEKGLLHQLTKALIEKALGAEESLRSRANRPFRV